MPRVSRSRPASVGWITTADVDAINAYVSKLRDDLMPLVLAAFATDGTTMAEWSELSGRVDKQLAGGSSWLYAPMQETTGRVIAAQLEAWKPRVAAAGHPLDSPPVAPTPGTPGMNLPGLAADVWPVVSRPLILLGIAWYLSRKVLQ